MVDVLRKLPHVAVASPVNSKVSTPRQDRDDLRDRLRQLQRLEALCLLSGGPFQGPDDVIVDDVFASADKGYRVGDTIKILDHPFRISGIVEHGKGGRKLMPIDTMGEMTDAEGKASLFYIKCDDPANDELVIQEIHATPRLEDYPVRPWTNGLKR
jgi:putative ABC transport system permease protein